MFNDLLDGLLNPGLSQEERSLILATVASQYNFDMRQQMASRGSNIFLTDIADTTVPNLPADEGKLEDVDLDVLEAVLGKEADLVRDFFFYIKYNSKRTINSHSLTSQSPHRAFRCIGRIQFLICDRVVPLPIDFLHHAVLNL